MTGPAEELRRVLSGIQREQPPEIPLDRLLDQLAAIRRRTLAAIGGLLAAGVLVAISIEERPVDPPVHLNIQVVTESPGSFEPAGSVEPDSDAAESPTEFDRP